MGRVCREAQEWAVNNCNNIQCNSFTNCDSIRCTRFTGCAWYNVPCHVARAACVVAAAIARAACWVSRAACIVAASPDCQKQSVVAGEVDGRNHIRDIPAPGDQAGMTVNHAVVDLAGVVILRWAGFNELPAKGAF